MCVCVFFCFDNPACRIPYMIVFDEDAGYLERATVISSCGVACRPWWRSHFFKELSYSNWVVIILGWFQFSSTY